MSLLRPSCPIALSNYTPPYADFSLAGAGDMNGDGYSDVIVANGSDIAVLTVVYIAPSLNADGRRLAIDLGIDPSFVRPIDEAPAIDPLSDPQILVYLGIDVENR